MKRIYTTQIGFAGACYLKLEQIESLKKGLTEFMLDFLEEQGITAGVFGFNLASFAMNPSEPQQCEWQQPVSAAANE